MVSKKELAIALSELEQFESAKFELEQYATEANLAAELLWDAHLNGRIEGKTVIDLGAGTGILAIGAALLGANVVAIEKDADALSIMKRNMAIYEGTERITLHHGDVRSLDVTGDLVIMNPPFGTKERHIDRSLP
jgi:putative methylase